MSRVLAGLWVALLLGSSAQAEDASLRLGTMGTDRATYSVALAMPVYEDLFLGVEWLGASVGVPWQENATPFSRYPEGAWAVAPELVLRTPRPEAVRAALSLGVGIGRAYALERPVVSIPEYMPLAGRAAGLFFTCGVELGAEVLHGLHLFVDARVLSFGHLYQGNMGITDLPFRPLVDGRLFFPSLGVGLAYGYVGH